MSAVTILDVFPGHFDQNGDSGNLLALRRRLEWAGLDVVVASVDPGDAWPAEAPDFVLVGGGSIPAQRDALPSLVAESSRLGDWIAGGTAYLAVAGGYALSTAIVHFPGDDASQAGAGVFPARSEPLESLATGMLVVRSAGLGVLHGYVNLRQRVILQDAPEHALGEIVRGPWTGMDGRPEGAIAGSAFGSHAHGPLLPKNPVLADAFIRLGLARRGLAERYVPGERHAHVDELARRARASLAQRLELPAPDPAS
ncbi:MAG: hypothetical protein J7480_09155 [Microbacteriaceae bacterium]|nr:hypothetical protein [Microbacteriaceae bacterium]